MLPSPPALPAARLPEVPLRRALLLKPALLDSLLATAVRSILAFAAGQQRCGLADARRSAPDNMRFRSIMATLDASLPCWRVLPRVLAVCPPLLLRVRHGFCPPRQITPSCAIWTAHHINYIIDNTYP
jgi:hypothetical protein